MGDCLSISGNPEVATSMNVPSLGGERDAELALWGQHVIEGDDHGPEIEFGPERRLVGQAGSTFGPCEA